MLVVRSNRAVPRLATLACLLTAAMAIAALAGSGIGPDDRAGSRGDAGTDVTDVTDVHPVMPSVDPETPGGVEPGLGGYASSCTFIRKCPGQSPCDPGPDGQPLNCDRCTYITLDETACRITWSPASNCADTSGWVVTCGPYWRGRCKTYQSPGHPPHYYCAYIENPVTECRRSMCTGT